MTRPVLRSDWERPLAYAQRVRSISIPSHGVPYRDPTTLRHLRSSLPHPPLFPNVRTLRWHPLAQLQRHEDLVDLVLLFIGPSIVEINMSVPNARCLSVLPAFIQSCCRLTVVTLLQYDVMRAEGYADAISDFVSQLPSLRELKAPVVRWNGIEMLSRFTNVQRLLLNTLPVPPTSCAPIPTQTAFPSLTEVEVGCTSLPHAARLLDYMLDSLLTSLTVNLHHCHTQAECSSFFAVLGSMAANTSLCYLEICAIHELDEDHPAFVAHECGAACMLGKRFLDALHPLAALTDLHLHARGDWDISDNDIAALGDALPNLANLSLTATDPEEDEAAENRDPQLSLSALFLLAERCPSLESIRVSLNARSAAVPALPHRRFNQCTLRQVEVGCSPVEDDHRIARYLSALFPELQCVLPHPNSPFAAAWYEISAEMERLVQVRKEEQEWSRMETDDVVA
ncbi:hypothetical protein MKEN_00733900 [Mycena kentingensis (nom. inval.)]|nr:hypothetical protein MKEN_00733900 [Mycena kentingensis (nom. inval.)]